MRSNNRLDKLASLLFLHGNKTASLRQFTSLCSALTVAYSLAQTPTPTNSPMPSPSHSLAYFAANPLAYALAYSLVKLASRPFLYGNKTASLRPFTSLCDLTIELINWPAFSSFWKQNGSLRQFTSRCDLTIDLINWPAFSSVMET